MTTRRALGACLVATSVVAVLPTSGAAVLPGANGKIAFASAREDNVDVYVVSPDGARESRLTNDPSADADPAWSPDGTKIAFTSARSGADAIYVMNAGGTGLVQLTDGPEPDSGPAWSPGGKLAFVRNRGNASEIFVMNGDGTQQTQLTTNDAADTAPAWSPDGSKIAFSSERDGDSEIYVMAADGARPARLTSSPGRDTSPSWSPDGTRIAFASARDGSDQIYVMNADGSDQRRLTNDLADDLDPAWSPDGKSIAFTSDRDGNDEIYSMDVDGSDQRRLTTGTSSDTSPDWQWLSLPPAPTAVEKASFEVRWRESTLRGVLDVTGGVSGLSKLQVALRRGKNVYLAAGFVVPKGGFQKKLALPSDLTPGAFTLDVTTSGSPTALSPQQLPMRLAAPPEGVVSRAWASATVAGPPLARVPAANAVAWAHFRFASLPRAGRPLAVSWRVNGRRSTSGMPAPKLRRSVVDAFYEVEGAPLPRGSYTCVLSAGGTIVKRLTFSVS